MTMFDFFDKHEAVAFFAVILVGLALIELASSIGKWGQK